MAHLTVADVMTKGAVCVPVDCDLASLSTLLLSCGIGGAPVVDGEGRVLGVVSKTDLLRAAEEGLPTTTRVRDVMTSLAFTVRADAPLARAAALLAVEGVHRAPVVEAGGRVVGMLSTSDLARVVASTT